MIFQKIVLFFLGPDRWGSVWFVFLFKNECLWWSETCEEKITKYFFWVDWQPHFWNFNSFQTFQSMVTFYLSRFSPLWIYFQNFCSTKITLRGRVGERGCYEFCTSTIVITNPSHDHSLTWIFRFPSSSSVLHIMYIS